MLKNLAGIAYTPGGEDESNGLRNRQAVAFAKARLVTDLEGGVCQRAGGVAPAATERPGYDAGSAEGIIARDVRSFAFSLTPLRVPPRIA
jgi:hypothetical protein